MGFSVSGSFAILVVGAFLALGTFYGAASAGVERVAEAERDALDAGLDQENTAINVTQADWQLDVKDTEDRLIIEAENTGARTLNLAETDVLVDGQYIDRADFVVDEVDPDGALTTPNEATDLWQPGETYHVEINRSILSSATSVPPDRVKLVTERGVSDAKGVT